MSCVEPFYVSFSVVILRFKTCPHPPQLFRRTLLRCFAVKLQKCFEDYETSPSFPSGRVDHEYSLIFG